MQRTPHKNSVVGGVMTPPYDIKKAIAAFTAMA